MEEMQHMQEEQQKTLADDLSSDEDGVRESIQSSLILEMCENGGKCSYLWKSIILDTMLANRTVHICTSGKVCNADKDISH